MKNVKEKEKSRKENGKQIEKALPPAVPAKQIC